MHIKCECEYYTVNIYLHTLGREELNDAQYIGHGDITTTSLTQSNPTSLSIISAILNSASKENFPGNF